MMIICFVATLLLMVLNLFVGAADISCVEVLQTLMGHAPTYEAELIVLHARLPEVVVALLAGGALSLSGLVMQTVFANPLADPSLLGVNAGASLGVAVAVLLLGGSLTAGTLYLGGRLLILLSAFVGALLVIGLLTIASTFMKGRLQLLVAGVMLSFVISSFISILSFFASAQGVQTYVVWGLGTFSNVRLEQLLLFALPLLVGSLGVLFLFKSLNALLLGEVYALNLGIRVVRVRTVLLLLVGLLTAVVTAFCGPISFIGLAVPHAVRFFVNTSNHRRLLPLCFLGGSIVALLCNILARSVSDYSVLPVNTLTPLIGVPVVLLLLLRRR